MSWSTHEGKLPQSSSTSKTGRRLAVADSSSAGSDSSEQDDEDEDEDEDDADEPIPMDSVMAPFKVSSSRAAGNPQETCHMTQCFGLVVVLVAPADGK